MAKEKLTPIPRPRKGKAGQECDNVITTHHTTPAAPDLSHISAGLRALAVPVGELQFLLDNPRQHGEEDLEATQASLEEYGQVEPLVVNRRPQPPVVLNGNGRLQGALALGWTHVAVSYVDLDEERANALAVILNRTGQLAGWNKENLAKALRKINTGNRPALDSLVSKLAEAKKLIPRDNASGGRKSPEPEPAQPALITCPSCGHQFDGTIKITGETDGQKESVPDADAA